MTKHYTDEGTLLIRNSDIKDGKFEFGDNPIYLEKTFAEKNETRMHQIGDVITVHTGDVGTSAVITENEAKSIGFATIVTRPNPKIIDSNYLCSFLNTDKHKKWAVSISTGDGRTNYNLGDYFELVVPVPSIAEQKKIASYIQKLNRLITLHQCKCQIDGCRFQSPLAITWEQRKLSDIAVLTSSKRVHAEDYVETGVPFYRGKEISELKEHKPISEVLYITEYKYNEISSMYGSPKEGDLLITAVGTLGNTWVIDQTPFYFKDGNLIWFKDIKCNPKYLDYAMSTADGQKKILASAIGSNQKALTMVKLNELEFMFPGKAEQDKIAEYFSYLDNLITLHQRKPVVVNSSSTMNALPNQHLYFQVLE